MHIAVLMRHHAWLVERLLDTAALLAPEQLTTDGLSHGSLLETLRHMADVDQSWGRVARRLVPLEAAQVTEACPDLQSLADFWRPEAARLVDFAAGLTEVDLEDEVQPPWRQQPRKVWQVLFHIANHGAEHGNEICWALTHQGYSPGELGFMALVDREMQGR